MVENNILIEKNENHVCRVCHIGTQKRIGTNKLSTFLQKSILWLFDNSWNLPIAFIAL